MSLGIQCLGGGPAMAASLGGHVSHSPDNHPSSVVSPLCCFWAEAGRSFCPQKLREAVPGYVNTWDSCRSTYSGSITPPHCSPHSSILFLGKDSMSGVSCSCSASSFEGRIQPWEILKKDQLFSQQPLTSCVGLGLLDWEQLIQSLLTNP